MRSTVVLALAVASLLVATISFAEDTPKPITVVSLFNVLPGKGETVMNLFKKHDKPVLDKLLSDGTILGYGLLVPVVHVAGAPTHATRNLVKTPADVDKVAGGPSRRAGEALPGAKRRPRGPCGGDLRARHAPQQPSAGRDVSREIAFALASGPAGRKGASAAADLVAAGTLFGLRMAGPVAVFVSPHGYGHAARACALMQALSDLGAAARFEVFTLVPEWFFTGSLTCPFGYHSLLTDVGLVQSTPLVEDLDETLRRLDSFLPFSEDQLDGLARLFEELGCQLALCDISPLGLAAARKAGIPSILIENFTWDWIYAPYAKSRPAFSRVIAPLTELFELATSRIQTEPVCRPDSRFPSVAPVSRAPRTPSPAVRARLGVPAGAPMVLVTMGGIPWQIASLDRLERGDVFFVVPGAAERRERRGSLIALPHRSGFFHPDLVHAADAVVGKLGYSTLAEAWAAGVPFGHVGRPTFRESPALATFVTTRMPGLTLTAEEIAGEAWLERVPELLAMERAAGNRSNGASAAARTVHRLLSAG
jgi:UDP:flavonoid glycosyltransferase YjiC (YdhE family)